MKLLLRITMIFFVLAIASCGNKKENQIALDLTVIDFSNRIKISPNEVFEIENITAVQLDELPSTFLSSNFDIQFSYKNYYVYDFTKNELYRFDEEGKILNTIGSYGHSHEEFINVSSFLVDIKNHAIEVLCNNSKYIKKYSIDGEFIEAIEVPVRSTGFAKDLNGEYWFYMVMTGDGELSYRLHHMSKENEVKSFLPLKTHLMGIMEQNFYRNDRELFFRESFFPYIYRLEKDSIKPFARIDFGDMTITEQDFEHEKDPYSFYDKINQKGFYTTRRIVKGEEIVSILCQFQKDGQEIEQSEIILDLQTKKYLIVSYNNKLGELLSNSSLIKIDSGKRFHYITDPLSYNTFYNETNRGTTNTINEGGNHVIFSIQFKELQ